MLGQVLNCRVGRITLEHVALRLRWYGPDLSEPTLELSGNEPVEVEAPAGWDCITVQMSSDDGIRRFALEPSEQENEPRIPRALRTWALQDRAQRE